MPKCVPTRASPPPPPCLNRGVSPAEAVRWGQKLERGDILHFFFFYKQVFHKQPQAQIAENLSTLLSTLSASDFLSKVTFKEKLSPVAKKEEKTSILCKFSNKFY